MNKKMMLLGAAFASAIPLWATLTVDPVFSSNMVLQQEKPITFFGTADQGKEVAIEFAGKKSTVKADAKGNWKAVFPAMKADKINYTASFTSGKEKIEFKDILLGEVWFCSGQSNMQMPVGKKFNRGWSAWNCEEEVRNANYPEIRYAFQRLVKGHQQQFPAAYTNASGWVKCSPEVLPYFSATAYFFGRQLHKDLNVPVGLINSSWGGTRIQAWISQDGYQAAGLAQELKEYKDYDFTAARKKEFEAGKAAEYSAAMGKYLLFFEQAEAGAKAQAAGWEKPGFDDGNWEKAWTGSNAAKLARGKQQIFWGRVHFTLKKKLLKKQVKLELNKAADGGDLYLNGKLIASFKANDPEGKKNLRLTLNPADLNWKGDNVLAFRGQYFYSDNAVRTKNNLCNNCKLIQGKEQTTLYNWKGKEEFLYNTKAKGCKAAPAVPYIPYLSPQFPSTLYNGMVAAWTRIPVRGVIWYQGCSNNGQPRYYLQQKALIADWRARWNNPQMPFIITQLAGFGYWGPEDGWKTANPNQPGGYALTRDLQFQAAKEMPNTGIACLLDIGEPKNIHPANKQDVGKRLALEAERIAYGKKIVSRGPFFRKLVIDGNRVRVYFDNVAGGLDTKDAKHPGAFAIAGADGKFVWAKAKIGGKDSVLVYSDQVPEPKYVRYGYMGYRGDCNLINKAGLPAYPFRSDAIDYTQIK